MAASAGGIRTLGSIVSRLPAEFPAAVLVVQHRASEPPQLLAQILARRTPMEVCEPVDRDTLRPGVIYVCPPGRHALVGPGASISLAAGPAVNFVCPSADLLFESVARHAGVGAVGVVLTGRGHDGAAGAAAIRRRGGVVLVQDPATCAAPSMPNAVFGACGADFVLPPEKIALALVCLVTAPSVSAALFGVPAGVRGGGGARSR